LAVSEIGMTIEYITNPSEKVQLAAIKKNIYAFKVIKFPCAAVIDYVLNFNSNYLRFIDNPTKEQVWTAVRKNGYAISHVPNPSYELQLAAIQVACDSIRYVKYPHPEIMTLAILMGYDPRKNYSRQDGY
jgi:hypothetical protein